ncbi:MAG: hypothetical protein R6W75_04520 [Smithellaceae bacterium]
MKHEISVENGIALVIISGKVSPEGYGLVTRDLVNLPGWKQGGKILIDYSYIDLSDETGETAQLYAQAVAPYRTDLGTGRCACVNINPVDFGLGRVWQFFMEALTDLQIGIFYTFEDAMRWLSEE